MFKFKFNLSGLTCDSCSKLVKKRIEKIDGVDEVSVDNSGRAMIDSSREISKDEIKDVLSDTDYKVL